MIINYTHRFAFIHIPKCAGTSVRNMLRPFDETNGKFARSNVRHRLLGRIDYGHIPLFILRQYFSKEYDKIKNYSTFSAVRDPFARFPSSLSQYLKMYGKDKIQNMKTFEIKKTIDTTISFLLSHKDDYLPYQYIHFQKQIDFIYDGQERIVKNVYPVSYLPEMLIDIDNKLNTRFAEQAGSGNGRVNQTIVYRNAFVRNAVEVTKPVLKSFLGPESRKSLREKTAGFFFVPRDKKLKDIFDSFYVHDFIRDYYASDIEFVYKLGSAKAEKADMDFRMEKDSV